MKKVELIKIEHSFKGGMECELLKPNITEDCIFTENGVEIGFYLRDVSKHSEKLSKLLAIANNEFLSDNVPKTVMNRSSAVKGLFKDKWEGGADEVKNVSQLSTIIGSVKPNPFVKRNYPTMSSVHNSKTAKNYIKAMLLTAKESEELIKKIMPNQYEEQVKLIEENVPKKWRFGRLFTSSISNFNISANFHRDTHNIVGCVNVILTKRIGSEGGNLNIPDYGATIDQCENSMLVYPAWKSLHGVTPILPTREGGYRNSLIFYPLRNFKGLTR